MNIEGFFALAFVAFALGRPARAFTPPPQPRDWICIACLLAITVSVFWQSLWFPLLSDDYILVTQAGHFTGSLLKQFIEPGGDGSYRPIGYALLLAGGKWAHADAFRWHAISLAVHAANSLLVYAAARYASKRSDLAAIAAAIFALHGTRPEAVTWTAGRWDVLAAFFVLVGLLAFLRYYDTGNRLCCLASVLLVTVAIMCKESAYAFPTLAVAFVAVAQVSRPVSSTPRLLSTLLAPAIMLAYRFILFHGPGGYVDPQTGRAQILSIRFLPTLKALFPRLWAVLIFPADWAQAPEFYLVLALVLMPAALIGLCVTRSSLDRKPALILATCTMAAGLPAVHLLAVGSDLLGSRIFYLPAVAFALFLSVLIASARPLALARTMAACVILFYASTLMHNLSIWGRVASLAGRTCVAAAPRLTGTPAAAIIGIPVAIDGVSFFANGFAECVALHSPAPPSQWTITHVPGGVPEKAGQRVLVWDPAANTLR